MDEMPLKISAESYDALNKVSAALDGVVTLLACSNNHSRVSPETLYPVLELIGMQLKSELLGIPHQ